MVAFSVLTTISLLVAIGYIVISTHRHSVLSGTGAHPTHSSNLTALLRRPHLVFLHAVQGTEDAQIAVAALDSPGQPYLTGLSCKRVYFSAGVGLCLGLDFSGHLFASYGAYTFDSSFRTLHTFQRSGLASRVRLSRDGRLGAMTLFVTGHSYVASFSTQTTLVDTLTGATLANLEDFTVLRNGVPFKSVDFNFWGVTFAADGNRFYATLATGGRTYLVEGDVRAKTARVLEENVECPSLSPDQTRLVFKKRVGSGINLWRLYVLNLSTMAEAPIVAETRSVDDQVEWLDNHRILYGLQDDSTIAFNIWVAPVDWRGPAQMLLADAYSPSVVR